MEQNENRGFDDCPEARRTGLSREYLLLGFKI